MPRVIPEPSASDNPFLDPFTIQVPGESKGTVTFEPEEYGSTFYLATVAISKESQTTYEIKDDGTEMFGPSQVPPTDIDDFGVTWVPCQQFKNSLEVVIRNLSGGPKTYTVLPMGYESKENRGEA